MHLYASIFQIMFPVAHAAESAPVSVTQLLGVDWKLFLAQLINFAIVLFVLWKWVFTPIGKMLQQRTDKIERSLRQSKEIEDLRKESAEFHMREMEKARREASDIISRAEVAATKAKEQIAYEAKQQADRILKQGEKVLSEQRVKMLAEAKEELATLVVLASEKLLREKIDPKKDEQLIRESLRQL